MSNTELVTVPEEINELIKLQKASIKILSNKLMEIQEANTRMISDLAIEVRTNNRGIEDMHSDLKTNMSTTDEIHRKVNVLAPRDKVKLTRIIDKHIKDVGVKPQYRKQAREWIKDNFVPNGKYKNMSINDLLRFETNDANIIQAFTEDIIKLTNLMQQRKIHQGWIEIV